MAYGLAGRRVCCVLGLGRVMLLARSGCAVTGRTRTASSLLVTRGPAQTSPSEGAKAVFEQQKVSGAKNSV